MKVRLTGANPYLPLWEHIPDGEPRLFTYNGEQRVYVYGSHDTLKTEYCGTDYVVWSAPADDLTSWRYEGVCWKSMSGKPLFAPDVVEKDGTYYMYVAENWGQKIYVASSKNPAGPFENPVLTELGFDPGVLVDDDGRVYAYWGFCECNGAELNDDMATIKKETLVQHMIPHTYPLAIVEEPEYEHVDKEYCFLEASSIRKVHGKYVYIYSKRIYEADPELGLDKDTNSYLCYVYSDSPLGGWKNGGTFSYCCGDIYIKPNGQKAREYYHCNNHGSIVDVNGQWYVFYHRRTGENEFSRQGLLEPIDAAVDKDGNVHLGRVAYNNDGDPISHEAAEMTSQGAYVNGIDAYKIISAGYTCCILPAKDGSRAYIMPVYDSDSSPIVNISSGTVIGFKYLQFGDVSPESVTINAPDFESGTITVTIDSPDGKLVAELKNGAQKAALTEPVTGKHAVYFTFTADDRDICTFDTFTFDR